MRVRAPSNKSRLEIEPGLKFLGKFPRINLLASLPLIICNLLASKPLISRPRRLSSQNIRPLIFWPHLPLSFINAAPHLGFSIAIKCCAICNMWKYSSWPCKKEDVCKRRQTIYPLLTIQTTSDGYVSTVMPNIVQGVFLTGTSTKKLI